jgi:hypothetical protein
VRCVPLTVRVILLSLEVITSIDVMNTSAPIDTPKKIQQRTRMYSTSVPPVVGWSGRK